MDNNIDHVPVDSIKHIKILIYFLHSSTRTHSIGGIGVFGLTSKNMRSITFLKHFFKFKLEQFILCGFSAALDLPLRQWRNGSSSRR
jgi:hypothetical protein